MTPFGWCKAMGAALLLLTSACAHERVTGDGGIPDALRVPADQVLTLAARGAGFQIYECTAGNAKGTSFAWTLKGPDAQLRYEVGKELGRHYAGPTWEANDGSKVVGEIVARHAGPDPSALPWLLLRAKQTEGTGLFGAVQSIQRLHTAGGNAPTTGCSASYAGTQVRVAYSADYYFYGAKP